MNAQRVVYLIIESNNSNMYTVNCIYFHKVINFKCAEFKFANTPTLYIHPNM